MSETHSLQAGCRCSCGAEHDRRGTGESGQSWFLRHVLEDEVEALRASLERVARLAVEYDEYLAFLVGVGARPGNQNEVHDAALAADQLWEALEGSPSTAKERWALGSTDNPQGQQVDVQERTDG